MVPVDKDALPFWFTDDAKGATQVELDAAERYIGFRLPISFRKLLQKQNGGISNYSGCENGSEYFPMLPIMGVSVNQTSDTLMSAHDVQASFGAPANVVVFSAMGHAWFGLEYQEKDREPSIVYRDGIDQPILRVAPSFDHFLQYLTED